MCMSIYTSNVLMHLLPCYMQSNHDLQHHLHSLQTEQWRMPHLLLVHECQQHAACAHQLHSPALQPQTEGFFLQCSHTHTHNRIFFYNGATQIIFFFPTLYPNHRLMDAEMHYFIIHLTNQVHKKKSSTFGKMEHKL